MPIKKAARFAPERLLLFGLLVFLLIIKPDLIELGVHGILKALLKRQEKLLENWSPETMPALLSSAEHLLSLLIGLTFRGIRTKTIGHARR